MLKEKLDYSLHISARERLREETKAKNIKYVKENSEISTPSNQSCLNRIIYRYEITEEYEYDEDGSIQLLYLQQSPLNVSSRPSHGPKFSFPKIDDLDDNGRKQKQNSMTIPTGVSSSLQNYTPRLGGNNDEKSSDKTKEERKTRQNS